MISEAQLEESLEYLSGSDVLFAQSKALMEGLKHQEKAILAAAFLESSGTVAEREANSRINPVFTQWRKDYENSILEYHTMAAKRSTHVMKVEVWRSLNASRRVGNL